MKNEGCSNEYGIAYSYVGYAVFCPYHEIVTSSTKFRQMAEVCFFVRAPHWGLPARCRLRDVRALKGGGVCTTAGKNFKKKLDIYKKAAIIITVVAGVAHPVERHLAKVEVASSSLVTRSIITASCFLQGAVSFCKRPPTRPVIRISGHTVSVRRCSMDRMEEIADMLVIGGGPGGCTAALYGARAGLTVRILERLGPGGQMNQAERIENYPGFPEGISGTALAERMLRGAQEAGAQIELTQVRSLSLSGPVKSADTDRGRFLGRSVVLAMGAEPKPLEIPGERELLGRGVSYCAACDGWLLRGCTAIVVGGGNSAVNDGLLLSRICRKVYWIHRNDRIRAERRSAQQLRERENVEFLPNTRVTRLLRDTKLKGVSVCMEDGTERELTCQGLFICVGRRANTQLVQGQLPLDQQGFIQASESTDTQIPGVFAAGDVRGGRLHQILTAAADGAVAASAAAEYLAENRGRI